LQDLRYACRALARSPGFSAVVIMPIALGVGAYLHTFSLMRAVLWRPQPYPEPDRIVSIQVDARNVPNAGATRRELLAIRERSRSFEQVSTIDTDDASLEYGGELDHVESASVSDDFLRLLGVRPALGRMLDSRTDENGEQPLSILISDQLWRRRFAADPAVIGRGVRLNGIDVQVAGVLPAGFRLFLPPSVNDLEQIDIWLPYRIDPAPPYRGVPMLARLRPGVTVEQANAELAKLEAQFEREFPDFYSGARAWQVSPSDRGSGAVVHFTARRLHDDMTRGIRTALFLLSGAVAFVLLIACVNAANLMLARGSARARELEIRRALGAGRSRIVRQLLSESLVLALASAAVGLLCAHFGLEAIGRLSDSHIPLQSRIQMDATVALFAIVLSGVTTVLFGFMPAWRLASGSTNHLLRAGRTQTAGSGARKVQRGLAVAEVALSIVPLACAGLMLRSFLNLMHSPLGFHPAGVVTARLPIDTQRFPKMEQRWALLRNAMDRLRA
jgi:predicted permease